MSHHYSGPDWGFPHGNARLDLTDLYAFPKPGEAGKSILIMNVHPSPGANPPGPTTAEPFAPEALYEIKIDTDGRPSSGCRRPWAGYRRGSTGLDGARGTGDKGRRLPILRGLAQRSILLRQAGRPEQSAVHRRRFLRRQRRVQHRA
jgi:hypothetical protein